MAFSKETKEKIKNYMMELFLRGEADYAKKTAECFNISLTSVYKYIKELEEKNIIEKQGDKYDLVTKIQKNFTIDIKKETEEDRVYTETIEKVVEDLPDNIKKIWRYAFTEMFNNVIDHSGASKAMVSVYRTELYTLVNIYDNGVGIFKKITDFYKYESLDDAVLNLFKGKLTTDKENHSGEGIFFTSKVMDHFGVVSSNKIFAQNFGNHKLTDIPESKTVFKRYKDKPGTLVIMSLNNSTKRQLKEVFDMFSDVDGGITKTIIPMTHICDSGFPVSRSQAKRLYAGFDKFEEVTLDFSGVDEIGQGFAHELFSVFQKRHPDVKISPININENIERMIKHVTI